MRSRGGSILVLDRLSITRRISRRETLPIISSHEPERDCSAAGALRELTALSIHEVGGFFPGPKHKRKKIPIPTNFQAGRFEIPPVDSLEDARDAIPVAIGDFHRSKTVVRISECDERVHVFLRRAKASNEPRAAAMIAHPRGAPAP